MGARQSSQGDGRGCLRIGVDRHVEILMHLRSLKRVRGEVSLYDPIGVDREGNEITLVDGSKQPPGDLPREVVSDRVMGEHPVWWSYE